MSTLGSNADYATTLASHRFPEESRYETDMAYGRREHLGYRRGLLLLLVVTYLHHAKITTGI